MGVHGCCGSIHSRSWIDLYIPGLANGVPAIGKIGVADFLLGENMEARK